MHEFNPITLAISKPLIPILGTIGATAVTLAGLAIGGWYLLKWINEPALTGAVTIGACAMAAHNVYVLGTLP